MTDVIEKPRRKVSLKEQVIGALEDAGATVVRGAKASKKAAQGEPTISISTPDGKSTGPVPMSAMKKALKAVGKKPKSAGAIVETSKAVDQVEAFTPREMGIAADHLRQFIERIERLEEEKRALSDDIKDVYGEAKGSGFDRKIIRKIVAMRRQDHEVRKEEEAILELYLKALGMA